MNFPNPWYICRLGKDGHLRQKAKRKTRRNDAPTKVHILYLLRGNSAYESLPQNKTNDEGSESCISSFVMEFIDISQCFSNKGVSF